MFIILSHTCSRISYITDCTLKKDNNQVNPLLPRHIPAEASDIHHISRVHSDYRIGRSGLHALRYGSCHFSSCDPFHIYYKALMTPQKCTVVKLFFEVIQLTSGFLFFSNSSNKSSPLLNIRISDPGTIRSSCL